MVTPIRVHNWFGVVVMMVEGKFNIKSIGSINNSSNVVHETCWNFKILRKFIKLEKKLTDAGVEMDLAQTRLCLIV